MPQGVKRTLPVCYAEGQKLTQSGRSSYIDNAWFLSTDL